MQNPSRRSREHEQVTSRAMAARPDGGLRTSALHKAEGEAEGIAAGDVRLH